MTETEARAILGEDTARRIEQLSAADAEVLRYFCVERLSACCGPEKTSEQEEN